MPTGYPSLESVFPTTGGGVKGVCLRDGQGWQRESGEPGSLRCLYQALPGRPGDPTGDIYRHSRERGGQEIHPGAGLSQRREGVDQESGRRSFAVHRSRLAGHWLRPAWCLLPHGAVHPAE